MKIDTFVVDSGYISCFAMLCLNKIYSKGHENDNGKSEDVNVNEN